MNNIIEKLSQILEENQTKLKSLAVSAPDYYKNLNKLDGSHLDTITIHPRDYLVDLLTEWSRQFLETCRELQTNSHAHERCKEIIGLDDFLHKESTTVDTVDTIVTVNTGNNLKNTKGALIAQPPLNTHPLNDVNKTESSLEELKMRYKSLVLTLENQLEETRKEVYNLQKSLGLSKPDEDKVDGAVSNIQASLLKTQERETHPEVERNVHEQQLQSMSPIKDLHILVRGRPCRFIENLAVVKKTENKVWSECGQSRDIHDKKSARYQQEDELNAQEGERLRLTSSINELTKQLHEQQSYNIKFASINDGLVELGRTQADQVRKLKEKIRLLQHRLLEKSKKATKVSKALRKATQAVSINRKQCEILRSKLEQCKTDLSRYCVEDMTSWKSET